MVNCLLFVLYICITTNVCLFVCLLFVLYVCITTPLPISTAVLEGSRVHLVKLLHQKNCIVQLLEGGQFGRNNRTQNINN